MGCGCELGKRGSERAKYRDVHQTGATSLLESPITVDGNEGRELIYAGLRDEGSIRAYAYAVRVDGPRTEVEFRGGLFSAPVPSDSTQAAESKELLDGEFDRLLQSYKTIVGSLRFRD